MTKNILIGILATAIIILSLVYKSQQADLERLTLLGQQALHEARDMEAKAEDQKQKSVEAAAHVLRARRKTEEAQIKLDECKNGKR